MTQEQLLAACQSMIATDPFFPAAEIDVEVPKSWRADCGGAAAGLDDTIAVQGDQDPKITRDGGAEDDYEMEAEIILAYAVAGADETLRRSRRDKAALHLANLVRKDRTLGTGDPQVYAEIAASPRRDKVPIKAAAQVATVLFTLQVTYVSASPAE
jgi:hypothetical protein